jgi:hypothetical protein
VKQKEECKNQQQSKDYYNNLYTDVDGTKFTLKKLKEIINEVFKDYKDPTESMTLSQKKEFHKAMQEEAKK